MNPAIHPAVEVTPRVFAFRHRSAAHFIDVFGTSYGPVRNMVTRC